MKQEKTDSEIWTPVKQRAACGCESAAIARKSDFKNNTVAFYTFSQLHSGIFPQFMEKILLVLNSINLCEVKKRVIMFGLIRENKTF